MLDLLGFAVGLCLVCMAALHFRCFGLWVLCGLVRATFYLLDVVLFCAVVDWF